MSHFSTVKSFEHFCKDMMLNVATWKEGREDASYAKPFITEMTKSFMSVAIPMEFEEKAEHLTTLLSQGDLTERQFWLVHRSWMIKLNAEAVNDQQNRNDEKQLWKELMWFLSSLIIRNFITIRGDEFSYSYLIFAPEDLIAHINSIFDSKAFSGNKERIELVCGDASLVNGTPHKSRYQWFTKSPYVLVLTTTSLTTAKKVELIQWCIDNLDPHYITVTKALANRAEKKIADMIRCLTSNVVALSVSDIDAYVFTHDKVDLLKVIWPHFKSEYLLTFQDQDDVPRGVRAQIYDRVFCRDWFSPECFKYFYEAGDDNDRKALRRLMVKHSSCLKLHKYAAIVLEYELNQ
jgi:hypothetical protein